MSLFFYLVVLSLFPVPFLFLFCSLYDLPSLHFLLSQVTSISRPSPPLLPSLNSFLYQVTYLFFFSPLSPLTPSVPSCSSYVILSFHFSFIVSFHFPFSLFPPCHLYSFPLSHFSFLFIYPFHLTRPIPSTSFSYLPFCLPSPSLSTSSHLIFLNTLKYSLSHLLTFPPSYLYLSTSFEC